MTNYCPECGARVIRNRLTPRVLAEQMNDEVLSLDNKFLRTFIDLFKRPEAVINGFIIGVRKRHLNVISYWAIALSVLGLQLFILKSFFPEFLDAQNDMFGMTKVEGDNPVNTYNELVGKSMSEYQNVMFTVLMPFLAIGTWIIYLDKRRYNYTEHLVINLYINSQWIFVGIVINVGLALFGVSNIMMASIIAMPLSLAYGSYVFKRLYGNSFLNSLLRYIAAFIIYMFAFSIIMVIFVIGFFIYLFATGKMG
ncbi:DUF3667 domain-containing protein [Winogradskyella maritima]|uniref:DUF3667 domain-containing protein n=1 Tax=Winogradskyella maritima TaxID=1517766 RepID=A0ABV8AK67_9FLAO|nr:DUF3667 domain-containing protein [Winogradskyella maritima]